FIGGFDQTLTDTFGYIERAITSQGCKPGSLYDAAAFGTPNGASLPYIAGLSEGPSIGSVGILSNHDPHQNGKGFLGLGFNPYFEFAPGFSDAFGTPVLEAACGRATTNYWFSPIDLCQPDPYGGQMQSTNLREIYSQIEPVYRAKADIFELSVDVDLTDSLTLTSQTVYAQDEYYASQDYNRYATFPIFNDSNLACGEASIQRDLFPPFGIFVTEWVPDCRPEARGTYADGFYNVTPGGVFTDPQLGPSASLVAMDLSRVESSQFNQEFRLASNYDAPFNFSMGTNFTRFETMNDYFVFLNAATLITHFFPFNTHAPSLRCGSGRPGDTQSSDECIYVDPNPIESINGEGHNYFRSANPYELTSSAIFGEFYWQATETLKLTAGARLTWDRKVFTPIPSQLLLDDYRKYVPIGSGPEACINLEFCQLAGSGVNGRGSPADPDIVQEWREPTGRLIVDWKPDLGFTDETMVYASISHGYKGGGANPPPIGGPAGLLARKNSGDAAAPRTFEPEFIDAFEVGTKNTLLEGMLVLNGSAFFYDYTGYQVSKIIDRSAANENFDAKVFGLEAEWIFSPTRNLRFNGTFGALRTEIADGERSIDLMDRTAGGNTPFTTADGRVTFNEWVIIKPWITASSNCVAPAALFESIRAGTAYTVTVDGIELDWDAGDYTQWGVSALCPFGNVVGNSYRDPATTTGTGFPGIGFYDPATDAPNGGAGFFKELGGNELPNAPHWTASLGAQYRLALPGGWDATLRGDFYWQSQSYARVYNTQYDKLRAWTNTNVSLWVENSDLGLTAEVYVKNAFDETPITDAFLNSDDSGLTTNVFTLDPRLIGVSVRKSF
ncbi:MAG TPA: TonB-dependent receptor, partial [Caulobacteraceae bacterium]|nr:TonB-dependent receptor [Caulobacteraceae bacterium]